MHYFSGKSFKLKYEGSAVCYWVFPEHSVWFRCSVVSNSLRPHGLQHARLLRPTLVPSNMSGNGIILGKRGRERPRRKARSSHSYGESWRSDDPWQLTSPLKGLTYFNKSVITGREEGSGWGTHVYLWQIHVDIWQNQYNIVKLKNKSKKKSVIKKLSFPLASKGPISWWFFHLSTSV